MRIDQLWPGTKPSQYSGNIPGQMYPSCAQIQVESNAQGVLPKGISIPKDFSHESPGMLCSFTFHLSVVDWM